MPRQARLLSDSGIYHVILRGINKQIIFENNEDKYVFIDRLLKYKGLCKYEIYAYCLMDNHIHIMIKEGNETISNIIKRISGSYVYWYNQKYQRVGHLFQERFKIEPIESEEYILTLQRYIHQNPVKAGIVSKVEDYQWSSIHDYIDKSVIVDVDLLLDMFKSNEKDEKTSFLIYNNEKNDDECMEIKYKKTISDEEVLKRIKKLGYRNINELRNLEIRKRNAVIKKIKSIDGVSLRRISRIVGLSKSVIYKI